LTVEIQQIIAQTLHHLWPLPHSTVLNFQLIS